MKIGMTYRLRRLLMPSNNPLVIGMLLYDKSLVTVQNNMMVKCIIYHSQYSYYPYTKLSTHKQSLATSRTVDVPNFHAGGHHQDIGYTQPIRHLHAEFEIRHRICSKQLILTRKLPFALLLFLFLNNLLFKIKKFRSSTAATS